MGGIDGDAGGSGEGLSAIGGAQDPAPKKGLAFFGVDPVMSGEPFGFFGGAFLSLKVGFVGEGSEGSDEDGAFGGFEDTGVAVVNRGVEDDAGEGPGLALVL